MTSLSVQYCFPAKCFCFHVGEQKIVRWCQIRVIWRVIKQFKGVQSHSHAQQPLQLQTCVLCRNVVLVKQAVLLRQFSRPSPKCLYSTTFQTPELLIQCGFIWKETMQLVSGMVEFMDAKFQCCGTTPSLIVSLWTFQPTLVKGMIVV